MTFIRAMRCPCSTPPTPHSGRRATVCATIPFHWAAREMPADDFNEEATPMRFIVPLLLALILVTPASALTLQDLLVPGAELDAGRLQFTDFQLVSSTGISAGSINVQPLAVGGLAFPALDVPHAVTQAY